MHKEYERCTFDNFTPSMKITKDEWLEYTTKKSSVTDDDGYNTPREQNQPRKVYNKPKYPDEPLYLDKLFFGFIFIIILVTILYNMLN